MKMKRIIMHWTAGAGHVSEIDREHYHVIVDQNGRSVIGEMPVEANISTRDADGYAAHTLHCNTGSIGIAVAGMAGAVERPFYAGRYPITEKQLRRFVAVVAKYSDYYKIPVTRQTVLTHAEVQPTLGIKQRGKWDICWLPGMEGVGNAITVGDQLRSMILTAGGLAEQPKTNWSRWRNWSWT